MVKMQVLYRIFYGLNFFRNIEQYLLHFAYICKMSNNRFIIYYYS